jgi:hypothetical protein
MRVLLVIVAIRLCRPVTRSFVFAGMAGGMVQQTALPHHDRQRTMHRHGHGHHQEQDEPGE